MSTSVRRTHRHASHWRWRITVLVIAVVGAMLIILAALWSGGALPTAF